MVPNKLLELGLDSYEISLFVALKWRGKYIFPGFSSLRKSLKVSKGRLQKSLKTLQNCNVITWDRGLTGTSNKYTIFGEGVWTEKKLSTKKRATRKPTTGSPGSPGVGHQEAPNYTNRTILKNNIENKTDFISLLERVKNKKGNN
jgi:hypothetical protein